MQRNLPHQMIEHLEQLIDASFSGRDELYAAAESLSDSRHKDVCRELANHLANHATELQQLLACNGHAPVKPLDLLELSESFFALIKSKRGDVAILDCAERCEKVVKERYSDAISKSTDSDTSALLERQRGEVEFGENVLHAMRESCSSR